MSLSIMQAFYHVFWRRFCQELMAEWIAYPTNEAEAKTSLDTYRRLGMPGAVGSTDCTHVHWARCPIMKQSTHVGKEKYATLSYEVTCAHNRWIIHVTNGHPGARNDKTIVKTDEFVQALKCGDVLGDVKFVLYRLDGTEYELEGAYLITDNGYHKIRIMQCPIKGASTMEENLWSMRLESIRKDVECCFGVLKGRFRILWSKVLFQKQEHVDNVFHACCILHNMCLVDSGLDTRMEDDANWNMRELDDDSDLRAGVESIRLRKRLTLHQVAHLQNQCDINLVDNGLRPFRELDVCDDDTPVEVTEGYFVLRRQLIDHFTYCKKKNLLQWI